VDVPGETQPVTPASVWPMAEAKKSPGPGLQARGLGRGREILTIVTL